MDLLDFKRPPGCPSRVQKRFEARFDKLDGCWQSLPTSMSGLDVYPGAGVDSIHADCALRQCYALTCSKEFNDKKATAKTPSRNESQR
jgi:hypothetical protein